MNYGRLKSLVSQVRFLGWKNSYTGCSVCFEANLLQNVIIVHHKTEHPKTDRILKVYSLAEFKGEVIEKHIKNFVDSLKQNHGLC